MYKVDQKNSLPTSIPMLLLRTARSKQCSIKSFGDISDEATQDSSIRLVSMSFMSGEKQRIFGYKLTKRPF